MVMEAPPSPDSVGRELVRQYYTLMNKAPTHLHRFYNNQSSFLHCGLDPSNPETTPVIGQKQIHQKIQQLNFRDCHAKISQVDSQATLGNGVVVQVTGELSNAGQPMRRFTQTFVLAAQSPKKYYVHNDIFRYQDEIISEEDCETENRSDVEDDINQERPALVGEMPPIAQQPIPYYTPPSAAPIQGAIPQVPPHHHTQPPPHVMPPQPTPVPTVNGAIHPDDLNNVLPPAPVAQHVASTQSAPTMAPPMAALAPPSMPPQPQMTVPAMSTVDDRQQQPITIEEGAGDGPIETIYGDEPTEAIPGEPEIVPVEPTVVSNEPKTYATLLKSGSCIGSGTGGGYGGGNVSQQPSITPPPAQRNFDRDIQSQQNIQGGLTSGQRPSMNRVVNNVRGGNQPRVPRQDSRGGPGRQNDDVDERRRSQGNNYNDTNQLFLGNLPHTATEEDLREIFSQFGHIVDLRIHSKQSKGGVMGARITPNYGFITYETQQGVMDCLAAKPIFFPNNDKTGTMLNVEEKKMKDRQFGPGNGRQGGPDNNGGGGIGGPRPRDRDNGGGQRRGAPGGGPNRGGGPPTGGPGGNRGPSNFNRGSGSGGPPNRGQNNAYGPGNRR
ncbi:ras GTPase-activating protein-binding protein 2 [Onthophagus taurus]|uniref:ras GTPase-activating protein-binding protein 2 n=1 Tax=Onthophagus taurus TaxID=166361 RepID=UPI000C203A3A|nr:ras GTPase-activating protein-binding protein 2 [Onthophagus taurus]